MATDKYMSPLSERYASSQMQYIFSQDKKFRTWRKLWIALAEIEQELGISITDEQIEELKAHAEDINYEDARAREKVVRHDVMSHVYAYGLQCPKAKGIIHLGATSCYVGDNTDIILMRDALQLVRKKLINVLAKLADFADTYKALPTLGFTHFQPAQPTTVGKRATLWMQEFELALAEVEHAAGSLRLLGSKGTTGTQASFLELFDGDLDKVDRLDPMLAEKMGFDRCFSVSGQTYPRLLDTIVVNALAITASAAMKMATDIRILQHLKEVEEPFEKTQIGSSAMAFLAIDGILDLCLNVTDGLKVYPKVIEKHLRSELPFMATENIMMDAVKAGGDRQELHERIRTLSMQAGRRVKEEGLDNNLLELIAADPAFGMTLEELEKTMDPARYIGCAPHQVERYLNEVIRPILDANSSLLGVEADIKV